jgi:glycosyltransferase involved in cell wall biosynthesis
MKEVVESDATASTSSQFECNAMPIGMPAAETGGRKPVVLVLADYYLPGYKGGGTIRSLANLVERLGGEFEFHLITRDRDLGASEGYPGIEVDRWQKVGGATVYYAAPASLGPARLVSLIRSLNYEKLYLNSFFSPKLSIIPLILLALGAIRKTPVVIAPRGEFAPGALELKKFKKLCYMAFANLAGLYRHVTWQATSKHEEQDIKSRMGTGSRVLTVGNLSAPPPGASSGRSPGKAPGRLSIVFLSRIARNKNLLGALSSLRGAKGTMTFHIYGPREDEAYWAECAGVIAGLPPNVTVIYEGPVDNRKVPEVLAGHDLFFLPSMGENFGHAIAEALRSGVPALISDRTPWNDLEEFQAGWSIPVERQDRFLQVLEGAAAWSSDEWLIWSAGARRFASERMDGGDAMDLTRRMLLDGLDVPSRDRLGSGD